MAWMFPHGVLFTVGRYATGGALMLVFQTWAGFVAAVAVIVVPTIVRR